MNVDPPPVEVKQLVQLHQFAADIHERRGDDAPMHRIQHRQQQERLVRGLEFGGIGKGWAGGAVEGGEVFYGGVSHGLFSFKNPYVVETRPYVACLSFANSMN